MYSQLGIGVNNFACDILGLKLESAWYELPAIPSPSEELDDADPLLEIGVSESRF